MQPTLSIIIPVYNTEKYIHRCINSILTQEFQDFELLLINDGSTDNSQSICESYAQKDQRIKVINKKNGGVSSARNLGLDNARGKFVTFVDADDYIFPSIYSIMISKYQEDAQVIVGFQLDNRIVSYTESSLNLFNAIQLLNTTNGSNCGYIWHRLFNRNLIKDLRFDTNLSFGEDGIFWFNYIARNNINKFIFSNYIGYYYFKDNVAQTSLSFKKRDSEEYIYLIEQLSNAFRIIISNTNDTKIKKYLTLYIKQKFIQFTEYGIYSNKHLDCISFFSKMQSYAKKNKFMTSELFSTNIHNLKIIILALNIC